MDIYSPLARNIDEATKVEIVVTNEEGETEKAKLLTGVERSIAIDTAALLGGNEYLIVQFLEEIQNIEYTFNEKKCLRWALTQLWGACATEKLFDNTIPSEEITSMPRNQGCLNNYFTKYNRVRLPRTMSSCLLYCGRYADTQIYTNPLDPMQRYFLINLKNFPYMNFPIGKVPDNSESSPGFEQCEKLAVIYFKLASDQNWGEEDNVSRDKKRHTSVEKRRVSESQKISESLSLELGMLSKLRFVGVVPVPNDVHK